MNVNDQWMLERMQQMAASMAVSLPQTGQNTDAPKTEKGESFQDLMNKAKDQQVEAPQKDTTSKKTDAVQNKDAVQSKETVQKTQKTVQLDPKTGLRQIDVTPEEAALLVAGYAKLSPPMEDGTVWMVTVMDENGTPVMPLAGLEQLEGKVPFGGELFANTESQWVLDEVTPEFTQALEQLLQQTGDPRPAQSLIDALQQTMESPDLEPTMEIVVKTAVTGQSAGTEQSEEQDTADADAKSAGAAASQPLFRDVKAAPVKVGENFQLDTQDPDMDANLADAIRFAAQQGLQQVEINLSPENLGSLTIKLTQAVDGTLQVVLHTANLKAASLLNQHADNLSAALQGYGQNEVRVEVQRNEDSQQAQQQQQQTDPNGHNRQSQQQQRRQEEQHSEDFVQRLRLGLFELNGDD